MELCDFKLDFSFRSIEEQAHAIGRIRSGLTHENTGNEFFDDKDMIEQTMAWRRLGELSQRRPGTHFSVRNRLAHTADAKNIAEKLCKKFNMQAQSINLAKAIVTAHDIGHMPLAHYGEQGVNQAAEEYGAHWDHDAAVLRILCQWSGGCYNGQNGLDLTLDVVEGIAKRYWRFEDDGLEIIDPYYVHKKSTLPEFIRKIDDQYNLRLKYFNHMEGQIASISDWIAFTATDIEDGLRVGEITFEELTDDFPFISKAARDLIKGDRNRFSFMELSSRVKHYLISDVFAQASANIARGVRDGVLKQAEDVRKLDKVAVSFSPDVFEQVEKLTSYQIEVDPTSKERVYQKMTSMMFEALISGEEPLAGDWNSRFQTLCSQAEVGMKEKADFINAYMGRVLTDEDVFNFIKKHDAELYNCEYGPYGRKDHVPVITGPYYSF